MVTCLPEVQGCLAHRSGLGDPWGQGDPEEGKGQRKGRVQVTRFGATSAPAPEPGFCRHTGHQRPHVPLSSGSGGPAQSVKGAAS